MSNAKYYFHKESISEPEGFSSFSSFRKYMGYLWDSLSSLYGVGYLGDFINLTGDPTGWSPIIPAGWVGSNGYVSSGEFLISMSDTTEYEGSIIDAAGISHPLKSYKFDVWGNAGTAVNNYTTVEDFQADVEAFFQHGVAHYDGTFVCLEPDRIKGLSNYNFFQEEYEDFSSNLDVSERSLPNAYLNYLYYLGSVDKPR